MLKTELKDLHARTAETGPPADPVRTLNGTKSLVYLLGMSLCCHLHTLILGETSLRKAAFLDGSSGCTNASAVYDFERDVIEN